MESRTLSVTSTITPSPVRSPSEVQGSGFQRTFLGNTAPPITDGGAVSELKLPPWLRANEGYARNT